MGLLCHSCVVKAPPRYVVSFFIKPLLRSKQPLYIFFIYIPTRGCQMQSQLLFWDKKYCLKEPRMPNTHIFLLFWIFFGRGGDGAEKELFLNHNHLDKTTYIHDKCSTIDILDEDWAILGCKVVLCLTSSLSEHPAHRPQNMPCVLILMGLTGMLSHSIFLFEGVPKQVTFGMLPEPWWSRSITSRQHPSPSLNRTWTSLCLCLTTT